MVFAFLRLATTSKPLHDAVQAWHGGQLGGGGGSALPAAAAGRMLLKEAPRLLLEEGGTGLSTGMITLYCIASVVLVAISGLMAGLVLGLLSLDRMDLAVMKRTGNERQRWLVKRVEPFTRNPHFTMCALVVVNAACNTALPLFIDRLLNPLAAILISVTAILIFAEIAPQAVCKRYGLEIGAYCSWLVRALMLLTAPVSWPLGKALDKLLGEESALFRRQELNALISLHAEPQQDGSVGALTSDEAQVIQGALELASKNAETVMTPLAKVFMLSSEAVIDQQLLATVIAAGHSRVPVHEGDNRQAILGLVLVKELVLVDETAGVRVKQLRLREMPFLRADIPLYDVLKIFRYGRKHMACLTRVAAPGSQQQDFSNHGVAGSPFRGSYPLSTAGSGSFGGTGGGGGLTAVGGGMVKRASPVPAPLATPGVGAQVEEVVGIVTIEDVLEELLQAEIVDETDRYEDNLQTVQASPQVSMKELPPHLRRFLSPHRSLHGMGLEMTARSAVAEAGRHSHDSAASDGGVDGRMATAQGQGQGAALAGALVRGGSPGLPPLPPLQRQSSGTPLAPLQRQGSRGMTHRSVSQSSLGAAAAATALVTMGGPSGGASSEAMAAALAAGVRAAELNAASQAQQADEGPRPGSHLSSPPAHPLAAVAGAANGLSHVTVEFSGLEARSLDHAHTSSSIEGSEASRGEEEQHRPLVARHGRKEGTS